MTVRIHVSRHSRLVGHMSKESEMKVRAYRWLLAIAACSIAGMTSATPITFVGSAIGPGGVPVSALAVFDISGSILTVSLQNTSASHATDFDVPGSTLTGLFWDFTGNPILTPVSATVPDGS